MKKLIALTILSIISSSVLAQPIQNGISIQALGGMAYSYIQQDSEAPAQKKNDQYTWGGDISFNYVLNPKMLGSLEVGYLNFGGFQFYNPIDNDNNYKPSNYGIQALAGLSYYFTNDFFIFAKGGAIYQSQVISFTDATDYEFYTIQRQWLAVGAGGLGYTLQPNLNLTLQYEHTFGLNSFKISEDRSNNFKPISQDAIMLGISYNFELK